MQLQYFDSHLRSNIYTFLGQGGGLKVKRAWSPLEASLKPPSSPIEAPLKPPSSPLEAPLKPPLKPPARSKMETIVYGGAHGGEVWIEVEWRPLYGGAQGEGQFK